MAGEMWFLGRIPIINYGVLGLNDFEDYESAYCLNSYYVSNDILSRAVNEAEPDQFKIGLKIVSGGDEIRHCELEIPDATAHGLQTIADRYLHHLEADVAIQAVGRTRFATRPREVVLNAMHDFHQDIGDYEEVRSLAELRRAFDVPSPKELDDVAEWGRVTRLLAEGLTAEQVAGRLGISRRTVFRRLKTDQSAKSPLVIYLEGIWHSRDVCPPHSEGAT